MYFFDIDGFIKRSVTGRKESLLTEDLKLNEAKLRQAIDGKSILVIGGAGTIGSSFIKAALKFKPARLFVIDTNENGLTELTRDLRSSEDLYVPKDYKTYPVNFGNRVFERMLKKEGPFEIVANFAAHKHVRSEKDHYSIEAMIDNNVLKAKKLLDLLVAFPPERFFCVSTDKAANPVNVMGASKKLMEEVIMAYSKVIPVTTARFANVAFSNGSLPFGFLERLMKRQPFSSPSDVKRYFVSPEESGQLCLLACILGESGDIFFPKIKEAEMKRFSTIAIELLEEIGMKPDYCSTESEAKQKAANLEPGQNTYPVYFFETNTSGEKPFEEFFTSDEQVDNDQFTALGVIKNAPKRPIEDFATVFGELELLFSKKDVDKAAIVKMLEGLVKGFHHVETGQNLDGKM